MSEVMHVNVDEKQHSFDTKLSFSFTMTTSTPQITVSEVMHVNSFSMTSTLPTTSTTTSTPHIAGSEVMHVSSSTMTFTLPNTSTMTSTPHIAVSEVMHVSWSTMTSI